MGLLKRILGHSCENTHYQINRVQSHYVSIPCEAYCKTTDACLIHLYRDKHQRLADRFINRSTFYYSDNEDPNELVTLLDLAWRGLCPKAKVPAVRKAIYEKQQEVLESLQGIDSYILLVGSWLGVEVINFKRNVQTKHQEMIEDRLLIFGEEAEAFPITEEYGSELYFYKYQLLLDITIRANELNVKNVVARCTFRWFDAILAGIFLGSMEREVIEEILDMHNYHQNVLNQIFELAGIGSLEQFLLNVKPA
ncbi:hypothetical protein [Vibrio harveyi]|uniref:hypothetical protein n=1 Tax=Vibrio harveyi TaxID=669 RepID=UPI002ED50174|nr:hypothetical protein V1M48_09845 [Vibrio harveyi]HDM8211014.1 hypothetical protein [Vibrio harveyi]